MKKKARKTRTPVRDAVLAFVKQHGVVRLRNILAAGFNRQIVNKLHRSGELVRLRRGLYALREFEAGANQSLLEVCQRVPGGVICLASALRFHEVGTQLPAEVHLALDGDQKTVAPHIDYPPIRTFFFSGAMYHEGIETHEVSGGKIRVYSIAKTVVDCFRFRNKIGLDIALEALKDVLENRRASADEITRLAKMGRVFQVLRPYAEAILA